MDQTKKRITPKSDQFLYLERWVDKAHFRAFVFDKDGEQKLANNHAEFEKLTTSGIWFASKEEAASLGNLKEKKKNVVTLSNSK